MKRAIVLLLICFAGSWGVSAQTGNWGVGPHLVISLPQSGFENFSRDGEGLGIKAYQRFHNKYFSLRGDFSYLSYGERRESEWVDLYYYLVTRRIESFQLVLGPQLTAPVGPVTLYAAAMGGWYHYHTVETVEDYIYGYPYSETKDSQDRWGWNVNGGVLIDLGLGPFIDLGVKYQTILDVETTKSGQKVKQDAKDLGITLGVVFFMN